MSIVFQNVAVLVAFAFVGWLFCRLGILKAEQGALISKLLVWLFLPAKLFLGFSRNCTTAYLSKHYPLMLLSVGILAVLLTATYLLVPRFCKNKDDQAVYKYSLLISNYGYMGYALVEKLYGESVMLSMMLFGLPLSLYIYTEGYRMLTQKDKVSFRRLLNPVFFAILAGCLLGLSPWTLPAPVADAVSSASACTAPMSMLLAGMTISQFRLWELLRDKGSWVVTVIKLVGIPLLLAAVLSRFLPQELTRIAVLLYSMPCGLNAIVFPKLMGKDCRKGAAIAMLSTLLCLATIPLSIQLLSWFY